MTKKLVQIVAGLAIGALTLWLLFRHTEWDEVGAAIGEMHLGWFLLAQVPLWLSFFARVQRWSYIVRAVHPATFWQLFSATQIGFLANFTLPARIGEVVRAVVLSRLTRIEFSKSFALVALDRVTDLFGLLAVVAVSLVAFRPSEDIVIPPEMIGMEEPYVFPAAAYRLGAAGVGIFLVTVVGAFVLLYLNRNLVLRLSDRILSPISGTLAKKVHGMLDSFADGFQVFSSPREMGKSIFYSLFVWLLGLLFFAAIMNAFRIEFPWYTVFVMSAMLAIAVSLPGAPGFVGLFHFAMGLTLVMVVQYTDTNVAKAFAIMAHLANYPPIILFGLGCLIVDREALFSPAKTDASTVADN